MNKKNRPHYDKERLPKHVAIIMDGNGRWAKKRHLPRQAGHKAGITALKRTIETIMELGIPVLTVYAFSTENWKRPADEVNHLMNLLRENLHNELSDLHENNIKLNILGDLQGMPAGLREELLKACETTAENTGLILNIALNYGGRNEIVRAVRAIAQQVKNGEFNVDEIDEITFGARLDTKGLPEPDLLIRTAGEMRISNFLLWQIAYTEIWVTDVLWPDFNEEVIFEAIDDYLKRDRRFGAAV
ncbi:MAG: isoprenyl transferase [Syntrophomonadaceae bacterium]|nr:isoprenyl transferase [Syntrophomonadaceae bacterium]